MSYFDMVKELSTLGVATYNFKESIKFKHFWLDFELDIPRSILPRKNATHEQCAFVFKKVLELIEKKEAENGFHLQR